MRHEWEIGETTYLKEPVKGYRHVEIVGFDGLQIVVRASSGWEFPVWEDELEEP